MPARAPEALPLPSRHLVLAGGGHSHAVLLRQWVLRPQRRPPNTRVTLVSREPRALYSGLVPALLAGRVSLEEASVDLRRLCRLAEVTFLQAEISGLDPEGQRLRLRDHAPLEFDLLSLDVGAVVAGNDGPLASSATAAAARGGATIAQRTPAVGNAIGETPRATCAPGGAGATANNAGAAAANTLAAASASGAVEPNAADSLSPDPLSRDPLSRALLWPALELPIKPLEPLLARLGQLPAGQELRLRGGGAAAVELALALKARGHPCRLLLRGEGLRLGPVGAARAAERLLRQAGIPLQRHAATHAPADLLCTGSRAPAWLAAAGLPVQAPTGRVLTEPCLRVIGYPQLFACGDCAVVASKPRPAAGVWAVRAADTLGRNLRRRLSQPRRPLAAWRPLPWALQLLGDPGATPRAIAWWGPLSWGPSAWLWHWKQRMDRRFIASFDQLKQAETHRG